MERVNFCPIRDCNPFFHLFETMWMMAGRNDVKWIADILPSMREYSDDGETFNAAYGHRLFRNWGYDQLLAAAMELEDDPNSRRAVATIWHPRDLVATSKDKPCNMQLVFSYEDGYVNMTVFNRSNDGIWGGVCGANIVHLSVFQEYVAARLNANVGQACIISNNLHAYVLNEKYEPLLGYYNAPGYKHFCPYTDNVVHTTKMIGDPSTFRNECQLWCGDPTDLADLNGRATTTFFRDIATPMYMAYMMHKTDKHTRGALRILDNYGDKRCDWIEAGKLWLQRRLK